MTSLPHLPRMTGPESVSGRGTSLDVPLLLNVPCPRLPFLLFRVYCHEDIYAHLALYVRTHETRHIPPALRTGPGAGRPGTPPGPGHPTGPSPEALFARRGQTRFEGHGESVGPFCVKGLVLWAVYKVGPRVFRSGTLLNFCFELLRSRVLSYIFFFGT